MTPWKWLQSDGWKSHAVPAYLTQTLIDDLSSREEAKGGEPLSFEFTDTTMVAIDMPGMIAVDRPWMTFRIDGLALEIPCEDVASFFYALKKAKLRIWNKGETMFVGSGYYKLHAWNRCVVLTPDLRDYLLQKLEDSVQEAEGKATAFWDGRTLPSQALREAAAKATGTPIEEIPDLGGHKQDRFKTLMVKKGDA